MRRACKPELAAQQASGPCMERVGGPVRGNQQMLTSRGPGKTQKGKCLCFFLFPFFPTFRMRLCLPDGFSNREHGPAGGSLVA